MLQLDRVSKSFGAVLALSEVSLSFEPGIVHAICGENGAGKSTLVKILSGQFAATAGSILYQGSPVAIPSSRAAQQFGISVVAQELSVCPDLSVYDNIWLGSVETPFFHKRSTLRARARKVLSQLGQSDLSLDTPVRSLSLGHRQLIEIARALVRNAHTLILDEPTATLSDGEIGLLFKAIESARAEGCAVVYISHRLNEIYALCSTTTVLRNGRLAYTGPTSALSREDLIRHMLGRPSSEMFPPLGKTGREAALTIGRLNVPERIRDFSARVAAGEIMCIAGQIGSGAIDVIEAIAGRAYDASGEVEVGGKRLALGSVERSLGAGVILVSGDRATDGIFLNLSVLDNLVAANLSGLSRGGMLRQAELVKFARASGQKVGIDVDRLKARAWQFSGGNQQKLAFGRLVGCKGIRVLVMNEPTRGIDVGARADIYGLMRSFCDEGYAILATSTDVEEVVGISDSVVTMYRGEVVGRYRRGEADSARIVRDITHPSPEGNGLLS
ncbi:sugar ABC transporter ATP-binding protein [Bradyrhizobium archetypum]|uniref:Sugar ABC transporter ATP-binding protein n=1 Tax=Bradyrhizobium archetypum TaxID=2721160 RepID=A0A7Y4H1K4_9BRAD|nr:sugar ABC transporter ATP-binding protein [Bradyrhizobium archetypum]NOJ45969.1 sugar ABC transporter ATP-binding protein [Bradyrhizobium archetypum]